MAKQKSRPEKRYVPQQESYRNLPGLRPTADTIVAAETPAPDGTGEKLRSLAEGLAAGNNALKDFFTMEKSFEETNRMAQKAQAIMGLPQLDQGPGRGFLDYGSDYGYQEGQGQADSIRVSNELKTALADKNYFVDLNDPKSATLKLNQFTQQFIQEKMGDKMKNPAYAEGAAKYMAAAKIEAMTEASVVMENQKFQQMVDNATTIVNQRVADAPPSVYESPEAMREFLGSINKDSERIGLNRDASTELSLMAISDTTQAEYTVASDASDIAGMEASIRKFKTVVDAAHLKDTSGMALGGVAKAADGSIKWKLEAPVKDLKNQLVSMVKDHETEVLAKQKVHSAEMQSQIFTGLQDKTLTTTMARDLIEKEPDAATRNSMMKSLVALENSKDYIDDGLVIQEALLDTGLTTTKVLALNRQGVLSTNGLSQLLSVATKLNQERTNAISSAEKLGRMSDTEDTRARRKRAEDNKLVIANTLLLEGYVEPERRTYLNSLADSGVVFTPELVTKTLSTYETKRQVKADAVQKKLDAKKDAAQAIIDKEKADTKIYNSFSTIPVNDFNPSQKSVFKEQLLAIPEGDTIAKDKMLRKWNTYKDWENKNRPDPKSLAPAATLLFREDVFRYQSIMHHPFSSKQNKLDTIRALAQLGEMPDDSQ